MAIMMTVCNVLQDPQMVLLSGKGARGVSVRCEKVWMLLPLRQQQYVKQYVKQVMCDTPICKISHLTYSATFSSLSCALQ